MPRGGKVLRLFKLETRNDPVEYFDNRRLARRKRDDILDDGKDATVRRGPDHWRGETFFDPATGARV